KSSTKLAALENAFATVANNGQIAHWNQDKDDDFSLAVLNRIRPYVHSTQLLARIDVDIENTQCMFCKKNARRPSSSCGVKMDRLARRPPARGACGLRPQRVPEARCEACARTRLARGVARHRLRDTGRDAGWKIGSWPSHDEIRAAFRG